MASSQDRADAGFEGTERTRTDASGGTEPARPHAPPTSRLGRLARLGALAPKALPMAAEAVKRAAFGKRTEEEERESREKVMASAKKTAEQMLKVLGEMKGLPLKFGQMASYVDGLAPPGYEEKFQSVLKKLQAKAPPLSPEAAVKVIREDLGADPTEIFASWEPEPFAAASIGQVHRATTKSGDRVAVKVQYPGIDKAIENDLKSLGLLESMIAPMGRKYQTKETLDELRSVFLKEVDYRHEAETQELFRRIHEGDDSIVIPRVFHALSAKRVLVSELVDGVDYGTFVERSSDEDRQAAALSIWRFMFKALYRHGVLYADPHPGNYRFLGGGRVAFLDFGCSRVIPPHLMTGMKRYVIAAQEKNWDDFYRACVEVLGYDPSDEEGFRLYTEYTKFLLEPLAIDAPYRYTREAAREAVAFLVRGHKKILFKDGEKLPTLPKPIQMPTEFTFVHRLQWGLNSVLAGLSAEANFCRITTPWIREPISPLPT